MIRSSLIVCHLRQGIEGTNKEQTFADMRAPKHVLNALGTGHS